MEYLFLTDKVITKFIYSALLHNGFFDLVFSFFSMIGSSILVWITLLICLIIFEEKRNHSFFITLAISILVTSFTVNGVLKNIIQRPRPRMTIFSSANCPKDYSFPSGHASTAFAAATVIAFYDKKMRWLYYSVAGLISFSRIYLGCHYFFDVIAGGIIGYLISFVTFNLEKK